MTISLGVQAAPITIPSVKGLTLAAATSELESTTYLLNVKTGFLNKAPPDISNPSPNIVLSQVPAAKTKGHQGDTITIYVLSPNAQFTVPSLANLSTDQAGEVLGQNGLTLGPTTTQACSNTVPIGEVISSNPAAGTYVNAGDAVSLTTSSGYCKVQVPSVIFEPQGQATQTLHDAHLQVQVTPTDPSTCSPSQVGEVTAESLGIGTFVPYNSTITISVCDASTEIPPTSTTTTTS